MCIHAWSSHLPSDSLLIILITKYHHCWVYLRKYWLTLYLDYKQKPVLCVYSWLISTVTSIPKSIHDVHLTNDMQLWIPISVIYLVHLPMPPVDWQWLMKAHDLARAIVPLGYPQGYPPCWYSPEVVGVLSPCQPQPKVTARGGRMQIVQSWLQDLFAPFVLSAQQRTSSYLCYLALIANIALTEVPANSLPIYLFSILCAIDLDRYCYCTQLAHLMIRWEGEGQIYCHHGSLLCLWPIIARCAWAPWWRLSE